MSALIKKKEWLYEISFIRPILLVLLVSYHAFCYNSGAWSIPDGVSSNVIYKWIALFSRAFRLEGFVFVSGYVFAPQLLINHKFSSLKQLIISKFQRLIIPSIIFGTLYYFMFSVGTSPFRIISGIGHLWYLPCLFWCFILSYPLINNSKLNNGIILLILFAIITLSILPLPFQLNQAAYYLFFFYLGSQFWKYKEAIKSYATIRNIALLWVLFVIFTFTIFSLISLLNTMHADNQQFFNALIKVTNKFLKAFLALEGILALYLTASKYMKTHSLSKWIVEIGNYGYGVYIFHQFILMWLYYKTTLPLVVGPYLLPWVGLIVALIGSYLLTVLMRSTKLGRKLL